MNDFTDQPIRAGCGPVHVNRFRIAFRPHALGPGASPGAGLLKALPNYLNPASATTELDERHQWKGQPTLCFHGRAKIRVLDRPFIKLSLPFGKTVTFAVPPMLRHLELPPVHVDYVGAEQEDATGVTVQTLTRHFPKWLDAAAALLMEIGIKAVSEAELAAGIVGDAMMPIHGSIAGLGVAASEITELLAPALIAYGTWINWHHFLAGRRSFRIAPAKYFNHTAGQGIWIFETAAVERFDRPEFQMATDYLLGGDKAALGPIWKDMCRKIAPAFGTVMPINPSQTSEGPGYWQQPDGNVMVRQHDSDDLAKASADIRSVLPFHPSLFV
ncbi:hypothetical protein [Polymorphobacter megasporae]|uniref:hypothetical protein n=1 Tax=Glacieibacterium megasporae TaxID=2835787 RepID=UPI001C1E17AB|nr:hypothetical protein [Polymorphobacter megasporae]UAJ08979.1 hypothetical protein KTC28_11480 [Polymorphobacter megasporae]